jgi:hypothetical protein
MDALLFGLFMDVVGITQCVFCGIVFISRLSRAMPLSLDYGDCDGELALLSNIQWKPSLLDAHSCLRLVLFAGS